MMVSGQFSTGPERYRGASVYEKAQASLLIP